jgi:hypothetical protein
MEPEAVVSILFAGWAVIFFIEYVRRGRKDKEIRELKRRLRDIKDSE